MAETKNPLLEALPPATDYLTYLTVIEYNLTLENLPTLHDVLQDTQLTVNIGWDLVHLLLPMLPASQQCLQDIARLGNPREVILKVTECLRLLEFADLGSEVDDAEEPPSLDPDSHQHPHITAPVRHDAPDGASEITQAAEVLPSPLPVDQFVCLLSMLSILHPRIKTKYPSRFLATSLQAVLHAFARSASHREDLVHAIMRFVKELGGTKRPHLPPRNSTNSITPTLSRERAPDPEDDTQSGGPENSETEMQTRLLQSIVTFVLEDYMVLLTSSDDVPGLCWASRLQEKLHPERTVPGRTSVSERFETDPALRTRLNAVGEILALSRDLGIKSEELLSVAQAPETADTRNADVESEPPQSAADVPYSKVGSLFLYTARLMSKVLYGKTDNDQGITIFPLHQELLASLTTDSATGATIGSEPEALLDTLLTLGLFAIENNDIGEPRDNEAFNKYLQSISLIASNCPSPSLRYTAYYLTTTVLRSNPSDIERLAFIRDTLEHCPFDNLKVAAVSWVKGETIEANPPTSMDSSETDTEGEKASIFATPVALNSLAPFLFPDLTHDLSLPSLQDSWATFDKNLHFYLASLNFYILLLSGEHLHSALNVGALHADNDIGGSFIGPLREAVGRFKDAAGAEGELGRLWKAEGDEAGQEMGKLKLVETTLDRVEAGVARLNQSTAGAGSGRP